MSMVHSWERTSLTRVRSSLCRTTGYCPPIPSSRVGGGTLARSCIEQDCRVRMTNQLTPCNSRGDFDSTTFYYMDSCQLIQHRLNVSDEKSISHRLKSPPSKYCCGQAAERQAAPGAVPACNAGRGDGPRPDPPDPLPIPLPLSLPIPLPEGGRESAVAAILLSALSVYL